MALHLSTIQGSGLATFGTVAGLVASYAPALGLTSAAAPMVAGAIAGGIAMILLKEFPHSASLLGEMASIGEALGESTGNSEIKAVSATVSAVVVDEKLP